MGRSKILKGSVILTGGRMASYGLSFARNIILARLLTKADFGLAALFGTTVMLLEVSSRMSFGQQIVQSKDGASAEFQASAHCFQFLFSLAGAVLILLGSYPVAYFFKLPHLALAFATLAVVPLARGFEHLDYYRQQRELNYMPGLLCELIPQAVVTLAAWPVVWWLKDFRAILWLIVGKAVVGILVSHFLAQRKYLWTWNAKYMRFMWSFGWPLLVNGLLIFLCQQGDQAIVAARLSLDSLAIYALAFSIVSVPWAVFAQIGSSLMLPVLSRCQEHSEQFRYEYRSCVQCVAVVAVLVTLPLILAGETVVVVAYGNNYRGAGPIVAVLAASCTIRFLRLTPGIAAMARADTLNQLHSNIWRGLSLPLIILVTAISSNLILIAGCSLLGELLAAGISIYKLKRRGVLLSDSLHAVLYVVAILTVAGALLILKSSGSIVESAVCLLFVLLFSLVLMRMLLPQATQLARVTLTRILSKVFGHRVDPAILP